MRNLFVLCLFAWGCGSVAHPQTAATARLRVAHGLPGAPAVDDGGVFDVTSTGEVVVSITAKLHVDDATLFAVTIERPGGVVVSRREHIVVTAGRS
jgi:hypothetical protein